MNSVLSGLYSGFVATGPMTLFMFEQHRQLPKKQKSPLPPATLSFQSVNRIIGAETLSANEQSGLTMGAHFGYGALAGVLYSYTFAKIDRPAIEKGLMFGAAFWTANYLGAIPALGFRASGTKMPMRRNIMMFVAHLVWGASLGYAEDALKKSGKEMLAGKRRAPAAE